MYIHIHIHIHTYIHTHIHIHIQVAVMMKNTLEQLEKSHKEIVGERDHLCANLKRELRDVKAQITAKQGSRALEVEMQVGSPAEAQVLEGARARSMLEEANAALRLALAQAHDDLAVVEEVAQVATQNEMNSEIEALVEGLRKCEEAMEAMRKRELESSALHEQRAREHMVLQEARDKDLATIQLCEAEILRLRLALHQKPSSSAKNGVAFSLPLLLGAQTSSAYTPRSWLTEATPRSADAWTSGSEGGSPASSPNPAWAGSHSLHMQQPDVSQEIQRECLLGMAVLQQNEDFQAGAECVTRQLSAKLFALEEELAHERGLRETADLLLWRQQQLGNLDNVSVNTSLSLLTSPIGPKRSAQNLTLSRSGSPASPLPEQSRQALLHLHTQRVRQLELELDGKAVTLAPQSSACGQGSDAEAVMHHEQGLRLEIHQLEQEKERLEREKAEGETAHAGVAAALADAAFRIADLEKQLQLQNNTAKSKIEALEMCASSSTTDAVSMSVQLAKSMVRGLDLEKQLQLQYDTVKQKTEALEMCVSSSTTAVASLSMQLAELLAREAAAAGATATAEARDVNSEATRGIQLMEAVSTIESLSRKIQASEATCESAKQRAVERECELDEAHLLIKSLSDRLREREGERQSWNRIEGQREILPGQESEAIRDTPGMQRDARVDGEEDNTLEEEEWGTPAFVLPETGDRQGEEKLQMLKEISALRNRESVLRLRLQEAETSLLQSAQKADRESNQDCKGAHISDFTLTRTPKALRFPASPEAPLSLSTAGADNNERERVRESSLRVRKRELETLLQGEHEGSLLSSPMLTSMTHLAESADMLLLRCQERLRTKMAAWDREEQEREEERIVRMRERNEWCRQSEAYVRRIAEMEKEGEECVEHLECEIDRLLNKVEETTNTPLRISRATSAIKIAWDREASRKNDEVQRASPDPASPFSAHPQRKEIWAEDRGWGGAGGWWEQEREEERIARVLERNEWCRQSEAYVRRIAEMEKEGEECVEHLECEIDRLLNKVEETTNTPLRIPRTTSAIKTPAHVLSPILQVESTPQKIPQRFPAAALSFSGASPALSKSNQVRAFSDIAEEDSIVTSTDSSSPMMIHPSSPCAIAGFVDEDGPAPYAAAHDVLLKGSYASHAVRAQEVNATESVPSSACTLAPQIAERRQQDEMEQVSAREKVSVQEMRELRAEYNALQLRHTALLQTQEPASVAIAESLAEAEEALKEREADATLTADKLASLMEEVAALKQTLKESGKQVCVPCAHLQAYTPALIYTQASLRSAADR
jgi:hypothetical protein